MAEVTPPGTGGPITLSGPSQDGALSIRGGIGGFTFQVEELTDGAGKLDDLAGQLSRLEVDIHRIWQDLCPFQDLPRWSGVLALTAVGESERSIRAVRTEVQAISAQVRACIQEYEFAEWRAGAARALWLEEISIPAMQADYEMHADFWRTGFINGSVVEKMMGGAAGAVPLLAGMAERAVPGMRARPVEVKREESIRIDLDASPAGLLERIREIDQRGAGFIEVIEIENDGQKAYVVVVPGTQMDGPEGANPFGLSGIVEGVGSDSRHVRAAVVEALAAAGAPKGATVVGVGYSQGGIHAMNLAASEDFLADYRLKYVLTAGSPVAGIKPNPDVETLHLEHRTDWVPGTDGGPNPDTRNQVTATMTNHLYVQTGEDVGIGPGHSLDRYQEGARLVAASTDPSLAGSSAALGAALGAGGSATATRFSLTRTKAMAPELQPADSRRQAHAGR